MLVPGGGAGGGCWVPGAGARAGAVSWVCAWWRQVAGAGVGRRRRRWVPGAGAGAGAMSWCWCRVPVLLVLVLGAGAGGVACIYVGILFAQIAKLWDSYLK